MKEDTSLEGSIIATFMFVELAECQSHCIFNDKCKSINYEIADDNTCKLNSATMEDSMLQVWFSKSKGWRYMSTDYSYMRVSALNGIALNPHMFIRYKASLHCIARLCSESRCFCTFHFTVSVLFSTTVECNTV